MPPPSPTILTNGIYSLPVTDSFVFKVQDGIVYPIYSETYGQTLARWYKIQVSEEEELSLVGSTSTYPATNQITDWINVVLDDNGGSENYHIDTNGERIAELTTEDLTLL